MSNDMHKAENIKKEERELYAAFLNEKEKNVFTSIWKV